MGGDRVAGARAAAAHQHGRLAVFGAKALESRGLARKTVGTAITSFELIPRIGIDFVLRHAPGTRDPLSAASPWYVLLELSSQIERANPMLEFSSSIVP